MIGLDFISDKDILQFEKELHSEVRSALDKKISKLNKRGPTIFRNALREAVLADPRTAKHAYLFKGNKYIKAENRPMGGAKVGSGLKFRFEESELVMRLVISQSVLREGYWPLTIAQYGRSELPIRTSAQGPYVLGIHKSKIYRKGIAKPYEPMIPNARSLSGDYFAVFTYGPIAGVTAYHKWVDKGKENAKKEFLHYARRKL